MAFQMIPPRVSSSPPPLDSLPTISCHQEDEDDDFANYSAGHNASFDITGLSDKLPPTPTSSPSKTFPNITQYVVDNNDQQNEKITGDSITKNLGVSKENQTIEFSQKIPSANENCGDFQSSFSVISNINGEETGNLNEINEGKLSDDDDFGEFESFPGENYRSFGNNIQESVVEENRKNLTDFKEENSKNGAIIDSSSHTFDSNINKDSQIDISKSQSPPCFRSNVSNSNDLSLPKSPPPTLVSPPRSPSPTIISPPRSPPPRSPPPTMMSPPPLDVRYGSDDDEDEFGEFTTGHPGIMEDEDDDFGDFTSTNVNSLSINCESDNAVIISNSNLVSPPCQKELIENKDNIVNKTNPVNRSIGFSSEQLENSIDSELKKDNKIEVDDTKVLSEQSSIELHRTEDLTKENFSGEIIQNQNQIMENSSVTNNLEISNETRTLELGGTNKQEDISIGNIDSTSKNGLYESCKSDTQCNDDDDDDDFGDFEGNFVQSNEVNSRNDDNDFDDFVSADNIIEDIRTAKENLNDVSKHSSLVNDVNYHSNLNPSNVDDDDDDFGDFDSARRDSLDFEDIRSKVVSSGITDNSYNDDLENNGDNDTFGDFENASISKDSARDKLDDCDDFGDFTNANFNTKHNLDDDEFGDFSNFVESENSRLEPNSNMNDNNTQAVIQTPYSHEEDKSQLVKKLESLLLRWIPPVNREVRLADNNTRRLQQVVKEDAFIWHQLEDLDSSPALNLSWPQSHAHKLFLASVNVDARNILFGQKWSSSVPLFAQTLTFSPLTPAKHIENTEECLQSENLTTKCPPKPAEDSVGACKSGEVRNKGEETEEKIPEAKFDWTSSGLTNPLESTGLEREFLSENGSSGSSGGARVKAPPSPSPLVQQILSGGTVGGGSGSSLSSLNTANITQINSLQPEVQQIVAKVPDLNFMKSRVLMFPIKGEQL